MGLCPAMSRPVVVPEHDSMRGKGTDGPEVRLEEVYCRYNECEARACGNIDARHKLGIQKKCDPDLAKCKHDPEKCKFSFCQLIRRDL
jgi:hypothetical protein